MKPTIGRIVHYHATNRENELVTCPAIITSVKAVSEDVPDELASETDYVVSVKVFGPPGVDVDWDSEVRFTKSQGERAPRRTWGWPPRVG